jgi:hypothetical protein
VKWCAVLPMPCYIPRHRGQRSWNEPWVEVRGRCLTLTRVPSRELLVSDTQVPCRGEPLSQEVLDLQPDIILAADCVYFEPAFPLLMQTLKDLLALVPTATVFFCFKKRRRADMQFLKAARKAFIVTEVEDEDRPVYSRDGLFLYTLSQK